MEILGFRERFFKTKKQALKSLAWYKSRGFSAFYMLLKADEWTKFEKDTHCINIFKFGYREETKCETCGQQYMKNTEIKRRKS